ncbi:MAG TPA: hypothetical protein PLY87_09125 [Planctomycetaceae bacterium]|nr:hypothetical protein [Planctomycetaceae bacterium]HQZ65225.1 hypothetical protein [Planctomycetaceae bacterium]
MKYQMMSLGTIAVALFAGGVAASAAEQGKETTHDGAIVTISSTELVMKGKDGKEHTHAIATDAKMTLDGKACKVEDLKAKTKIRVTVLSGDPKAVTHIEGIEENKHFAHTHDGTVVSCTSSKLMMKDANGKEHTHSITADTKITCDGKDCKASDLKANEKIRVTTKKTNKGVATEIEAIDKNGDFA